VEEEDLLSHIPVTQYVEESSGEFTSRDGALRNRTGQMEDSTEFFRPPLQQQRHSQVPAHPNALHRGEKRKYYAVFRGRTPGIYRTWAEAEREVKGFAHAKHQAFNTMNEVKEWWRAKTEEQSQVADQEDEEMVAFNGSLWRTPRKGDKTGAGKGQTPEKTHQNKFNVAKPYPVHSEYYQSVTNFDV
jgi:hypothetical protein